MIRRLWRSTFGLVAIVALLLAVVTVGIAALAYEVTHEALEEQLDHRAAAETAALLAEAHRTGVDGLADAIRRRDAARSTSSLAYLLVDPQGRPIAGDMTTGMPLKEGYEELFAYRRDGHAGIAQTLTTKVDGGFLIVGADRADLSEIDRTLLLLFSGALATVLLLGIGAAGLIAWLTRNRLARIDATALAIIDGDLARRVPIDGSNNEFDRLALTLNRMLDRISGLMVNLRQVSSDVAHDLRTPLTRLLHRLDRAIDHADPDARIAEIEAARDQARELLDIFASLLRIAEIEGMAEELARQEVDLSTLIEQMAETYRPDMETSGHLIEQVIAPGLSVRGDRRLLSQAVANLLDNCLRHTPAGTTVRLSLGLVDGAVRMTVADNGPGIAPADAPRLFQRFARAERARSTPGHGLGLALVAAIAAAHGGEAELEDGPGFGIRITLPRDG